MLLLHLIIGFWIELHIALLEYQVSALFFSFSCHCPPSGIMGGPNQGAGAQRPRCVRRHPWVE